MDVLLCARLKIEVGVEGLILIHGSWIKAWHLLCGIRGAEGRLGLRVGELAGTQALVKEVFEALTLNHKRTTKRYSPYE